MLDLEAHWLSVSTPANRISLNQVARLSSQFWQKRRGVHVVWACIAMKIAVNGRPLTTAPTGEMHLQIRRWQ